MVSWYLWIGRAKNPGPDCSQHLSVEVFNVGGWLSHGDLALDSEVDFLAVTEHRLIPARVRSEWARLKAKRVASVWALASQDASHVGNAGVGVVSLKGAPLALPVCATAQFKAFFDCVVGSFVALCLLVLVVLCIWLFCMVIKVLLLTLSSLL